MIYLPVMILILFLLNQAIWIWLFIYQLREIRRWQKHYYIMKKMRDSIVEGAPCDIHVHYEGNQEDKVYRMEAKK